MNVDKNTQKSRIRIRYPDGFEIEIEGERDFVEKEKKELLYSITKTNPQLQEKPDIKKALSKIIDFKENIPYIKIKTPDLDEKMAFLIILTAFKKLLNTDQPRALDISKSMRLSGYFIKRIDISASKLIKDSSIRAYGTKRNRTYLLTDTGCAKAEVKILNLTEENRI